MSEDLDDSVSASQIRTILSVMFFKVQLEHALKNVNQE